MTGVGHRVVHGGASYAAPILIGPKVIRELTRLVPLTLLHQPHHLTAINAVSQTHSKLPQVACFDTAFYQSQPTVATIFAIPLRLTEEGVRQDSTGYPMSTSRVFYSTFLVRMSQMTVWLSHISAAEPACAGCGADEVCQRRWDSRHSTVCR